MKQIISWCLSHIEVLSSLCIGCISLIIVIFKPRTKANTWDAVMSKILTLIPGYIYDAETQVLGGDEKKQYVVDLCERLAHRLLHRKLTNDEYSELVIKVEKQVEAILYCPTKKGGIGREA